MQEIPSRYRIGVCVGDINCMQRRGGEIARTEILTLTYIYVILYQIFFSYSIILRLFKSRSRELCKNLKAARITG